MARITKLANGKYDFRGSAQYGIKGEWNTYQGVADTYAEAASQCERAEEAIGDLATFHAAPPNGVSFLHDLATLFDWL